MKNILLIVMASTIAFSAIHASEKAQIESMWERANTMYINADYQGAIAVYDSIVNMGYTSPKLYYNLANAHFKNGQNGKAIVYYNKALQINPSDADTRYNLDVANSYIKDDISEVPTFFLIRWLKNIRQLFSSNTWAIISLVALLFTLCGLLIYLLPEKQALRKIGFFFATVMFILFTITTIFAAMKKHDVMHSSYAVITNSAVSVKSSPDNSSTDIFLLHEGTKVKITGSYGDWSEIMIPNGSKGWLQNSSMDSI